MKERGQSGCKEASIGSVVLEVSVQESEVICPKKTAQGHEIYELRKLESIESSIFQVISSVQKNKGCSFCALARFRNAPKTRAVALYCQQQSQACCYLKRESI